MSLTDPIGSSLRRQAVAKSRLPNGRLAGLCVRAPLSYGVDCTALAGDRAITLSQLGNSGMDETPLRSDEAETKSAASTNSLERMIGILDLFGADRASWTVEELQNHLGYPRSTIYRYLKILIDAELLSQLPDIGVTLGSRFIEMDRYLRRNDPLIRASLPVMIELANEAPGNTLLCRRYRDKMLGIHKEQGARAADVPSGLERGMVVPLVRGCASSVILAFLPPYQINKVIDANLAEFAAANVGDSPGAVRDHLKQIRQRGWDWTLGEVTPGIIGIAAPIFDHAKNVLGSLTLTVGDNPANAARIDAFAERVSFCARVITHTVSSQPPAA